MSDKLRVLETKIASLESKCAVIADIAAENAVLRRRCDVLETRCASLEVRCAEYDTAKSVQVPEQLTRATKPQDQGGVNKVTVQKPSQAVLSNGQQHQQPQGATAAPTSKPNFAAPPSPRYADSILVVSKHLSLPNPPPETMQQQPFMRIVKPELRARPLLPRGGSSVSTAPPPPPNVNATVKDHQLEMRIRKREANRRSDEKRLAKEQKLREDTAVLANKVVTLRAYEAKLKNENEALKQLCYRTEL